MIIESIRTGMRQNIPDEQWKQMKESGDARHFRVINRSKQPGQRPIPITQVSEYIKGIREANEKLADKKIDLKQEEITDVDDPGPQKPRVRRPHSKTNLQNEQE